MMNNRNTLVGFFILVLCLILPGSDLSGQKDLPGVSVYEPVYLAWNTYSAKISLYDSSASLIPQKFNKEVFVAGGDNPESAAGLYWSATSKNETLAISASPDSLAIIPDFAGRQEFYKYNPRYQLISKAELITEGINYAYIHYNLLSDVLPDGIEGVMVLQKVGERWFHYAGNPIPGLNLTIVSVKSEKLASIFTGLLSGDPRLSQFYEANSGNTVFNLTQFIYGVKSWYTEEGEIKKEYLDILRYPNWKQ